MSRHRGIKQAIKFYDTRNNFWLLKWFDKFTNDRYRYGLTMHFPMIFSVYVICQILANVHLWVYLSPHYSPLTVYSVAIAHFDIKFYF